MCFHMGLFDKSCCVKAVEGLCKQLYEAHVFISHPKYKIENT